MSTWLLVPPRGPQSPADAAVVMGKDVERPSRGECPPRGLPMSPSGQVSVSGHRALHASQVSWAHVSPPRSLPIAGDHFHIPIGQEKWGRDVVTANSADSRLVPPSSPAYVILRAQHVTLNPASQSSPLLGAQIVSTSGQVPPRWVSKAHTVPGIRQLPQRQPLVVCTFGVQ